MKEEPAAEPAPPAAEIDPVLAAEVDRQLEIVAAGSVDFFGREELRPRLAEALHAKRPLRVKLGMDPTAPDLHLGHTVVLHKLRAFQQLGHTPIFLIGDFTASIGGPSGRSKTRPPLAADEIEVPDLRQRSSHSSLIRFQECVRLVWAMAQREVSTTL